MSAYAGLALCSACLTISDHVHEVQRYIGGHGYVRLMRCDEPTACQERQEKRRVKL